MAKVHDKFVIELAEVIKGYGNDPDVYDPFCLSEFYRFYELPEIAVSANHFKTMIPLEVVEKNAQPGWIPCSVMLPENDGVYLVTLRAITQSQKTCAKIDIARFDGKWHKAYPVVAWQPLPTPYREGGQS